MKTIIQRSFNINIQILKFLGFYPSEPFSIFEKVKCFTLYFTMLVMVTSSTMFEFVKKKGEDVPRLNLIMAYLTQTTCFSFKLLPFLTSGSRIKRCINFFGDPFFEPTDKEEKKIIDDCVQVCRNISLSYFWVLVVAEVFWVLPPFLQHELPIDLWLPYGTSSDLAFYPTFVFLGAASFYAAVSGGMIDPLIGGLAYQATTQLKILKYNLQELGNNPNNEFTKKFNFLITFENINQHLHRCVIHHDLILNFVSEYEQCFSWCLFSQIAGCTFVLCFCSIGVILSSATVALQNGFFVVLVSSQIFFYCYFGTLLYEENNDFISSVYMSPWYRCDVKIRKVLILMMEKSKKPMIVRSGKIVELTLKSFGSLLKTSYSLIAVFKKY